MADIFAYLILGALQGFFEWIPISSQGVVAVASRFLFISANPVDIALFLHLGTVLAVLFYFRKDWLAIFSGQEKSLFVFLAIATSISLLIGFFVYQIASTFSGGKWFLLLTGVGLLLTAFFQKKKTKIVLPEKNSAFLVGALQGLSAMPGISRSGSTIFGLSFFHQDPRQILRLSYLMSLPVGLASSCYIFLKSPSLVGAEGLVGLLASFLVGYLCLRFLMEKLSKINFFRFALFFAVLCFLGFCLEFFV